MGVLDFNKKTLKKLFLLVAAGIVLYWLLHETERFSSFWKAFTSVVAPFVLVTFTAATTFGITRYRVPSEVALTILAGLGTAWITARDRAPAPSPDE